MVKILENIKYKAGFVLVVALATLVGGLTTNLVRADVPDVSGLITACYKTSGGDLNIIDIENSETCSNKETQLQWDTTLKPAAYGFIDINGDLDVSRSHNVNAIQTAPNVSGFCIDLTFTPKNFLMTMTSNAGYSLDIKDVTTDNSNIDVYCDTDDEVFIAGFLGSAEVFFQAF